MILLFTDFGLEGPYLGEMTAVLRRAAAEVPVVNLMADAPAFRPELAAYLLAGLAPTLQTGDVLLGVVDPGVGGSRRPIAIQADGCWFVGPDNGLFELALRRARDVRAFEIVWRPARLSASFHGRDLFAPVAARLARGPIRSQVRDLLRPVAPLRFPAWPDNLAAVIYGDRYGNAITGLRAATMTEDAALRLGAMAIPHARTFSAVPAGQPFWYANSSGLVEIAVNGGSAMAQLGLVPGTPVAIERP